MWWIAVVVVAGLALVAAGSPASAASTADDEVTCPGHLGDVALSLDEEFAGTPRALANDEGVLVRYTLLCPYDRTNGQNVAELTLTWSRYPAEDLSCATLRLTSEPAGDGRIQGELDHPSLSARVTYGAATQAVRSDVDEVAAKLLDDVPASTAPCQVGSATSLDGAIAPSGTEQSSSVPLALAAVLLGLTGVAALVVIMVVRRLTRRRDTRVRGPAAAEWGERAGTHRARREGTNGQGPGSAPESSGARPVGGVAPATAEVQEILRGADHRCRAIDLVLADAGRDAAMHRAHAAAVRRLTDSIQADDGPGFLLSYAGVMALAAATTNLVSATARRAHALTGAVETPTGREVARVAAELDEVHQQVIVAAEAGLDDGRFWLWQDRRLAVVEALAALERIVPRLVAVQHLLAARVRELTAERDRAGEEAGWARSVLDGAATGSPGASASGGVGEDLPFERAGR